MKTITQYTILLIILLTPVAADHIDCSSLSSTISLENLPGEHFGTVCSSTTEQSKDIVEESKVSISSASIELSNEAEISWASPWIAYERESSESDGLKTSYGVQNLAIGGSKAKLGVSNSAWSVLKYLAHFDYGTWQNEEIQWIHNTAAGIKVLKGNCIIYLSGRADVQQLRKTDNDYSYLNNYHYVDEKEHKVYNLHPEFDGGKSILIAKLKSTATEIENNLNDYCGDERLDVSEIIKHDTESTKPLVEAQPTVESLILSDDNPEEITVSKLKGIADVQLPDGSWESIKEGDVIPVGAIILTGFASEATITFHNSAVLVVRSQTSFTVQNFEDTAIPRTRIDLHTGELRFKVKEGDFESDAQVHTPHNIAGVTGTDFSVAYNPDNSLSIFEIYDGSIEISNVNSGEKYILNSEYGIQRLEIGKNGLEKDRNITTIIVLIILAIAGFLYYKYKKK